MLKLCAFTRLSLTSLWVLPAAVRHDFDSGKPGNGSELGEMRRSHRADAA